MDPHRCGPGLFLAAACVLFRTGVTLWTDTSLSCDGRYSTNHLSFEREVFDMETHVCGKQEFSNAILGTVDILQHCRDGRRSSNHADPHHSVKKYPKNSSDSASPQGEMFTHCGGSFIVGYSKSGRPLFANTTLCQQGTMDVLKRRNTNKRIRSKPTHAPLPSDDVFKSRKSGRGRVPPNHSAVWNHSLTNLTGVQGSSWNHSLANLTAGP